MKVNEEWLPVVGYENLYEISNQGRLRNYNGLILRGCDNKRNGYKQYMLYDQDHNYKLCYAHRLVAEAFLPPTSDTTFVRHINGDKADNRLENLVYSRTIPSIETATKDTPKVEIAAIVRKYDLQGRCLAKYEGWQDLEDEGFAKTGIKLASKGKYTSLRNGKGDVYKNYKWSIE